MSLNDPEGSPRVMKEDLIRSLPGIPVLLAVLVVMCGDCSAQPVKTGSLY